MKPSNPITTLSSRISWTCPWYSVRSDDILLPNGTQGIYHVVQHPGAVWIIPVTNRGQIVLIYTYRYTVQEWGWEIPAGGIPVGQDPLTIAQQELQEEVGGTARHWHYLGKYYSANGFSNETGHYYLATGVTLGQPTPEPTEIIEVHSKPIAEVLQMARQGQITDTPSLMALFLCEPQLRLIEDQLPSPFPASSS